LHLSWCDCVSIIMLCKCSLANTNILLVHVENRIKWVSSLNRMFYGAIRLSFRGIQKEPPQKSAILAWSALQRAWFILILYKNSSTYSWIILYVDDAPRLSCSERHLQTSLDCASVPAKHGERFIVF
jgi:hypothetical protein